MILYHGSNVEIGRIDLSLSKVGKDFGCGFYLSADKEQARELAERKTEQLGTGVPTLNAYEFDTGCLDDNSLRILEFQSYSKEWAEFVLKNRRNRTRMQIHPYDIVIGPIADDAVGYQIRMTKETFMIEEISKDIVLLLMEEQGMSLEEAMRTLYTSDTYDRLSNPRTGLYTQSTAYVYEYLEKELTTGKIA